MSRISFSHPGGGALALGLAVLALTAVAQEESIELDPLTVVSSLGMSDEPAIGLATPVTQLRYAPGVDLQRRGYGELQADITVRGSTFEQTGVTVGALPLFDAQTGHYTAEVPFPSQMLGAPRLLTGSENARRGFNANVATLHYGWAPVRPVGEMIAGLGSDAMAYASLYQGMRMHGQNGWAADFGLSHSQGDGTIDHGDFEVWRGAARLQHRAERSQTDFVLGYLDKFYGWPRMYTGGAFVETPLETDDYQTLLAGVNHHQRYGNESRWSVAVGYRQVDDDYKFDRFRFPDLLYQHRTRAWALGGEGEHVFSERTSLLYRGVWLRDELVDSTSLTSGDPASGNDFTKRNYLNLSAGVRIQWGTQRLHRVEMGLGMAGTNEDSDRVSPRVRWESVRPAGAGDFVMFADYAETSQVPGYTALRSNPDGLFGGNPNLEREVTDVVEIGGRWTSPGWRVGGSLFWRKDEDLVDWTYAPGSPNARQANPVAVDQWGAEWEIARTLEKFEVRVAYAWIEKDAEYGSSGAGGSFYVLNYPIHRVAGRMSWKPRDEIELAAEGEYRMAETNPLRTGGREAIRISGAVRWRPWSELPTEIHFVFDNLLDDDFEDFPGTPAVGRHGSLRVLHRW